MRNRGESLDSGITVDKEGNTILNAVYKGNRIYARLKKVSAKEANQQLRERKAKIDAKLQRGTCSNFCDAAERYLIECERRKVRTLEIISYHVKILLPWIGNKTLREIHSGSLQAFIDKRIEIDGVSATTVNRSLEVVRTILIRAARVWRTDDSKPWLESAPLIEMLEESRVPPYPISWEEQARLFAELPPHLARTALFTLNTGARDQNVCGLKWAWEKHIPEIQRSVFLIPASEFKGKRMHVLILNDVAMSIVNSCRGENPEYVFTYKGNRVETANNTAFQKARIRANLAQVRVHDLRHTFAQRLRQAEVPDEDRSALMGHAIRSMAEHYATPTVSRLVELANRVQNTRDSQTMLRIVNG